MHKHTMHPVFMPFAHASPGNILREAEACHHLFPEVARTTPPYHRASAPAGRKHVWTPVGLLEAELNHTQPPAPPM